MVGKNMSYILFGVIVFLWAFMDYLSFHKRHNQGFWSLKTMPSGFKIDAWHVSKWIILFIVAGEFLDWDLTNIMLMWVISVGVHTITFHLIF